jgi:hypothetical protein
VVKATNGRRDVTVSVPKDFTHGLVRSTGGHVVDLRAEAEAEKKQKQDAAKSPARALLKSYGGGYGNGRDT